MTNWKAITNARLKPVPPETACSPLNSYFFRLGAGFDHVNDALAGRRLMLARGRQRPVDGEIMRARHQQLFSRKACDDLVAGLGDDDFLFDPGGAPSIS